MTESDLIELAARAIWMTGPLAENRVPWERWVEINAGNDDEPRERHEARAALTAINLPQMLEVVAAARAVTETKETARLAQNTRVQELNARGQQYYDRVVEWIAADHAHDEALKHLAISLDPLDPS